MATDTKSTVSSEHTTPPQFTLRQALLAIGGLCVVLAFFRLVGIWPGIGLLFVGGMIAGSVISLMRCEWWLAAVLMLILAAACVCLLLPAVGSRPPSKRSMCSHNLRSIAVALHSYHDRRGSFPPAYLVDKAGRPMHSWRVLIMADLDPTFYEHYRFDEPWDGPNNSKLAHRVQNVFRCPCDDEDDPKGSEFETSYLVVVGPKTVFPGDKCVALSDVTDDHGNTILVVEVHNSGIHWMEPRDLHVTQMARTVNPAKGQGISSKHRGGANVVMADGGVQFLSAEKLAAEDVQSLLTIDGNEPLPKVLGE